MVRAQVLDVDVEKERISLSIKALGGDKFAEAVGGVKRGSIITVEVTAIEEGGIEVRGHPSSAGPTCRVTGPNNGPNGSRSGTRWTCG